MIKTIPIIIVEFNSYDRTVKYIKEFLTEVIYEGNISFVIVDNAVNDDNYKSLNKNIKLEFNNCEYQEVEINDKRIKEIKRFKVANEKENFEIVSVKAKDNYGFAIGNNIGANVVNEMYSIEHIIFSNSDIRFEEKFNLNKLLLKFNENDKIALVGPRIIGLDGIQQTPAVKKALGKRWDFNNLLWPFNEKLIKNWKSISEDTIYCDEDCKVYRILGAFMIFDFNKFLEIGLFDEKTFLYAEELIIAEKLIKNNYITYYYSGQYLVHEQGGTTNKTLKSLDKLKIRFNSEIYYYEKYCKYSKIRISISKMLFRFYSLKVKLYYALKNK